MKTMKFSLSLLICLLFVNTTLITAKKSTIFVIGDSTASKYGADRSPRTGWAQVLQSFLDTDSLSVSNHAASGRSSKSFYDEGRWTTVKNAIQPGDFVFIQFAHNDSKSDEERHTDPATTFKDYLNIFISGTIEKGGHPVLLSSIPRNNWSGSRIKQAHKPYTESMKEEAAANNVPFVDMEAGTMELVNMLGKDFTTYSVFLNAEAGTWPNYPEGVSDGTHLQEKGAIQLCKLLSDSLKNFSDDIVYGKLANSVSSQVRISVKSLSSRMGTLSGSGVFPPNTSVTLTAHAASGRVFNKWTLDGDTATYSTDSVLTLVTDSVDLHFQAHFGLALGTETIEGIASVNLYPNPAKDVLNIELEAQNWSTQIIDFNGKVIHASTNKKALNTQGIAPGLYVINVVTASQKHSQLLQIIE